MYHKDILLSTGEQPARHHAWQEFPGWALGDPFDTAVNRARRLKGMKRAGSHENANGITGARFGHLTFY